MGGRPRHRSARRLPALARGGTPPQDVQRVGAHTLWLDSLEPHPHSAGNAPPGDYRVVLKVGGTVAE